MADHLHQVFNDERFFHDLTNKSSALDNIAFYVLKADFELLLLLPHFILGTHKLRPLIKHYPFLVQILFCLICNTGGSTCARLLLATKPPWIEYYDMIPWILIVWYTMVIWNLDVLLEFRILRLPLALLDEISRVRNMWHYYSVAVHKDHLGMFPVLLITAISGCGGSLLSGIPKKLHDPNAKIELFEPTWNSFGPLVIAIFWFFGQDPYHYFTGAIASDEILGLTAVALWFIQVTIADFINVNFTPPPFNIIAQLFFQITRIPYTGTLTASLTASHED